jgi:glycosyltransferase involved in cell wall biosynthesis
MLINIKYLDNRMDYITISIVIPCYNMEKYIDDTLRSIINQKYPKLELIIVDGGSNDGTNKIINRYTEEISLLISESDDSMYDAIDKGIKASTGDIVTWLNADDIYFPWTLKTIANIFTWYEDVKWISGLPAFINEHGDLTHIYTYPSSKPRNYIKYGWFRNDVFGFLQQESMFWRRGVYFESGGLNLEYKYAGDFELWMKFAKYSELTTVNMPLAAFRRRKDSLSKLNWINYQNEVKSAIKDCREKPNIFWYLSNNQHYQHVLRLLTYARSKLIYYSISKDKHIIKDVSRSLSSHALRNITIERF